MCGRELLHSASAHAWKVFTLLPLRGGALWGRSSWHISLLLQQPAKALASRSHASYLTSSFPWLCNCSAVPAERAKPAPTGLVSATEAWECRSAPGWASTPASVGGSGGWKAGDVCFLFIVPHLRGFAWKSITLTPKLQKEERVNTPRQPTPGN